MTTSPEALREVVERAEAWARIIERPAPDGDNSLKVAASVAEQHARDLRALLSALQVAREALGPFAVMAPRYQYQKGHVLGWENGSREIVYVTPEHFRRSAEVYRALSPGGAEQ